MGENVNNYKDMLPGDNTIASYQDYMQSHIDALHKRYNDVSSHIDSKKVELLELEKEADLIRKNKDNSALFFYPSNVTDSEYNKQINDRIYSISEELIYLNQQLKDTEQNLVQAKDIDQFLSNIQKKEAIEKTNVSKETQFCEKFETKDQVINNLRLRVLQTQEEERKRIAVELHDSTVQNLTNLVHKTELCSRFLTMDTMRANLELQVISSNLRNIIDEMRTIIYDLRPMSIDDLGLIVTVDRYIKQMKIVKDVKNIEFKYSGCEVKLPSIYYITIFRIIQEACNNAIKHSQADHVIVSIDFFENHIDILIDDDGIGFEMKDQEKDDYDKEYNFGISILKERVYLLSGSLNIETSIGNGTKIKVHVPILE